MEYCVGNVRDAVCLENGVGGVEKLVTCLRIKCSEMQGVWQVNSKSAQP